MSESDAISASCCTELFGKGATSDEVKDLFVRLNTLRRPCLPADDEHVFHDWVLIRRQGIELGFADSEYHAATPRFRWGHGGLILTQAYFYAGAEEIAPYAGALPHGLLWSDDRAAVRRKLVEFAPSLHTFKSDTWDVDGYRLTVHYAEGFGSVDRMALRLLPAPIAGAPARDLPTLFDIAEAFGSSVHSAEFAQLWRGALDPHALDQARQNGEMDWTSTLGATLVFAGSGSNPVFRAVTLHRNRDMESVGWAGELPAGLAFDDDASTLFSKIPAAPVQQADSAQTGHAVWHFDAYTLHVLYSHIDNRLLRVKLMAPGTWRCIDEG